MNGKIIVVPTYNHERYIEAALKSILAQGNALTNIDYVILVDDCSTDRTIEIARTVWNSPVPLKVFKPEKNRGEHRNVNELVYNLPKSIEWFLVLEGDDMAYSDWLQTMLRAIADADEKVATICTSWDYLLEDGTVIPGENRDPLSIERIRGEEASVVGTLLRGCWWHFSSCAIRTKAYRQIGGFSLGLPLKGDWDFLLRLLSDGWDVLYVPKALMIYRANPAGVSSTAFRRHLDIVETLNVIRRYEDLLTISQLARLHLQYLQWLLRRLVGGFVRMDLGRSFAALPVFVLVLRSLARCLFERVVTNGEE